MAACKHNGFLVVFEGIDGTGKSTQANLLAAYVESRGLAVMQSREPTYGPYGKALRESATSGRRSPDEELELFILDRRQHVEEALGPALASGTFVIVDRYYLSTAAYQGARGLDPEMILRRNEEFAPIPDIAVLLELEVADGRDRIRGRGDGDGDLFEVEEELRQVARVFAALDRPYIFRIDGARPIDEVSQAIRARVEAHPRFRALLKRTNPPQRHRDTEKAP